MKKKMGNISRVPNVSSSPNHLTLVHRLCTHSNLKMLPLDLHASSCNHTSTTLGRRALVFSLPTILLPYPVGKALSKSQVGLPRFDPVPSSEKEASNAFSKRVSEAIDLLEKGRQLQAQGDFRESFQCFTQIIEAFGDLALTEYARVGRALSLYEVGDREEAIAEMEDVSVSLKGYPEVHAALAAAFYVDKHAPLLAEQQFTIATLLDPRYTDLSYVRDTKHWPPSLIHSLERFINLS